MKNWILKEKMLQFGGQSKCLKQGKDIKESKSLSKGIWFFVHTFSEMASVERKLGDDKWEATSNLILRFIVVSFIWKKQQEVFRFPLRIFIISDRDKLQKVYVSNPTQWCRDSFGQQKSAVQIETDREFEVFVLLLSLQAEISCDSIWRVSSN